MTRRKPWAKLTTTQANAAGVAVLLVIAGSSYLFGIRPADAAAAQAESVRTLITAATAEIDAHRSKRNALERKIAEYEERLANLPSQAAVEDTLNERLLRLSNFAQRFGLTVVSSDDNGSLAREHYTIRTLTIHGRGGYAEVAGFIHACLAEFPDQRVTGLRLVNTATGDSGPEFRIDCAWYLGSTGTPPK